MIVEETEEWEVDPTLNSRQRYRELHYLVQWAGYNHICTSWEPPEHIENAQDLVDKFHRERPDQPGSRGIESGVEIWRTQKQFGHFILLVSSFPSHLF